ncbi:MAG: mannose-1-phosphate guanylyltransferase [Clostridia bacterium]|nr:mannose-1-phosphate guanylyltransferase [Clostridia bacterium]
MKVAALIMAGGRGERFWPKSRKSTPKQFLTLTHSDRTMIQSTVDRIRPLVAPEDIFIATNKDYRDLVRAQLPEIPEENILCEPMARNTAPCIGWGAVTMRRKYGDALMMVLPSDHIVLQPQLYLSVMRSAMAVAEETDALVTLGIPPASPDTGYGYIQFDTAAQTAHYNAFRVKRFVEKPDLETARQYLASGEYLWNSGMFVWKVSAILREIRSHLPDYEPVLEAINGAADRPEAEARAVLEAEFPKLRPISVDYGILEHSANVYVLPASFGWDDVGSWLAVGRISPANDMGNVIRGDVVTVNSTRCIVQGGDKTIAMVGLEDTIIVDTKDALLVCAKDSAGEIRKVLEILRAVNRTELL